MGTNFIPFSKKPKNKNPNKGPALISKGPKKTDDGAVLDHGTIGDLEYKIYSRGGEKGTGGNNAATDFMNMMTMQAAKQFSIDMSTKAGSTK